MGQTIGLGAYAIRIKKKGSAGHEYLKMLEEGELNAFSLFKTYLLDRKNMMRKVVSKTDEAQPQSASASVKKVFMLVQLKADSVNQTFCGLVLAGECGRANPIYNVNESVVAHEKKLTEADMPPFYFRLHVPEGKKAAVLILQKTGIYGIKSVLERDMANWFSDQGFTLKIHALLDAGMLEKYIKYGTVDDVTVIAHKGLKDSRKLLNKTRLGGQKILPGMKAEIKFSYEKGFAKSLNNLALKALKSGVNAEQLVEVAGLENPDEVLLTVDYQSKRRKFSLQHPAELGISYDVTNDISYDEKNHPEFGSIDDKARERCIELMNDID